MVHKLKKSEVQQKESMDFSKIKVGLRTLEDATINIGNYKKINPKWGDKAIVMKAIDTCDYASLREISNFFYKTSGIYSRLCRYMAYLYRYDWMITPFTGNGNISNEKLLDGFNKALAYLDNFQVKRFFGEVALKVIRNGCYYGYVIQTPDSVTVQELPPNYCRSRYQVNRRPVVEFNMAFFDDLYTDTEQRNRILNLFPKEFKHGYKLYKSGKLPQEGLFDKSGWYTLDPSYTVKFNINGEDFPAFISIIPAIIDLDNAQDLDRKKMEQQLLKIIIQQMPLDKNGDLVFDVDEAQMLHANAVRMLGKSIGVDVLTTFADTKVETLTDSSTITNTDELERVERAIYNEAGVSQMQFNTDGNIALEKSILNDEAAMYNLLVQFEDFLNMLLVPFNKSPKKVRYHAQILTTTIYNYQDMAKLYKEQMQLGYSKMLAQIALGQSQSSILANAYFENEILDLVNLFIPPLMSSTMNAEILNKARGGEGAGRPEKKDSEKSEKTIQNQESMS